jgi:hypothetical protein
MKFDLLLQKLKGSTSEKYILLAEKLESSWQPYVHYPPFWRLFGNKLSKMTFNWQSLVYSSNANPIVPVNTPGLYVFVLQPPYPTIFPSYSYVMYVGMTEEGLIERLNGGYRTPSAVKERPHVHRMLRDYGKYLVWNYLPLPGYTKKQLTDIETLLLGYFCDPPINKKDQPVQIKEANKSKIFP